MGKPRYPAPRIQFHGTYAALIVCENEKMNPWKQSYAVEKGFKPTDNVVSVFSGYTGNNNVDHTSVTGKALLDTIPGAPSRNRPPFFSFRIILKRRIVEFYQMEPN